MVGFLDYNGLYEIVSRIKELCHKWVKDTKKREQIIIGKAIRMQSCDVKDAENWYVQKGRVCVCVPKNYQSYTIKVYHKAARATEYKLDNFIWDSKHRVVFLNIKDLGITKWKVDKYEISDESKIISVWLSYKTCPSTIKGTSLRYEYINGRKVWNHSFTIEDLKKKSFYEICKHYRVYQRKTYNRNRKTRILSRKEENRNFSNLRWGPVRMYETDKNKAGLYRAICIDKKRRCTKSLIFYLTQSGMKKRA